MEDFRLKVFQSVARHLSFTRASKELFISQPAISRHIRELETAYNVSLFERQGNAIRLTSAGRLLQVHADRILNAYSQLGFEMNLLTEHFDGELRIGASTTLSQYVLPPYLASFIQKFPQIRLTLTSGNSREIEQALTERRIDIGLTEGCSRQPGLRYQPFMEDELVVVAPVAGRADLPEEITLEELKNLPVVIRENGSGSLEVLERRLAAHHVRLSDLNVLLQLGSTESIKLFMESATCLGILSVQAIRKELALGRLRIVDVRNFECKRMFHFVRMQGESGGLPDHFIRFVSKSYGFGGCSLK